MEDKDNTVLEEERKLNESVSQLRSELAVTKNVNNLLLTRLTTLERLCWANAQYSRRECLDIVGVPDEVSGEVLEEKVLKIFGKLGCDISPDRIEACHRVGRTTDTVLVKLSKRKDCQHVWSVKKDLENFFQAWCKSGTRTPVLGIRDPPQSLKVGPGTPLMFKNGTPGPPSKLKSGTPGPPSKFKSGTPTW